MRRENRLGSHASAISGARLTPGVLPGDTDFAPNAPDESGGSSFN
jgi:hypothetical protein